MATEGINKIEYDDWFNDDEEYYPKMIIRMKRTTYKIDNNL